MGVLYIKVTDTMDVILEELYTIIYSIKYLDIRKFT